MDTSDTIKGLLSVKDFIADSGDLELMQAFLDAAEVLDEQITDEIKTNLESN